MIKRAVVSVFPLHSRRGRWLKKTLSKVGLAKPPFVDLSYQNWITNIEPEMFLPIVNRAKQKHPLFSIVTPFFNTPEKYLYPLIDSIIGQSFEDWELIAGDGSNNENLSQRIKEACNQDERIKYYKFTKDTDISGNTNQAIEKASGDYIVFCDHDDLLSPHALNEVASQIQADSKIDILYSDEDKLSDNGRYRHNPFFKPDWSPHLFLQTNYTNHLSVIRRNLVEQAGGLHKEFNGAQDYDLLLRVLSLKKDISVAHIDKILYHWREADGSTAVDFSRKQYAFDAGQKALKGYLSRKNIKGDVEQMEDWPGFYEQILRPQKIQKATIYINASDKEPENLAVLEKVKSRTNTKLEVTYKMVSDEIKVARESDHKNEAIFVIKAAIYPKKSNWLDRLVGVLELGDVCQVAPRIISADQQRVVDMGTVYDTKGHKISLNQSFDTKDNTPNGHVKWVRDVDELNGGVIGFIPGKTSGHKVVWSHVDFISYPVFGSSRFFNSNLDINADGKIILNE